VKAYAARHPTFPTDATVQQLYDDEEFEAYRALGYAATEAMLAARDAAQEGVQGAQERALSLREASSP
jgi:hypothetical protein